MRRTRSFAGSVLAVALAAGMLTGCSAVDNVVGGVVDEAKRQVQEQVDKVVGDTLGGAGITLDGELPDGFPGDAVPLVDGEVQGGATAPEGGGWAVQLRIDDIARFEEAGTLLEGAGYSGTIANADATSAFGTWTSAEYTVTVTVSGDEAELTALYLVVPA